MNSTATIIAAAIAGAFSLITAFVTYVLTRKNALAEFQASFETALRSERREGYRKLWQLTGLLPRYARTEEVTLARLQEFAVELRKWYFDVGGVVLSEASRDTYFGLQKAIAKALPVSREELGKTIDDELYKALREQCSALRTALCKDLGSRTPPLIGQGEGV